MHSFVSVLLRQKEHSHCARQLSSAGCRQSVPRHLLVCARLCDGCGVPNIEELDAPRRVVTDLV